VVEQITQHNNKLGKLNYRILIQLTLGLQHVDDAFTNTVMWISCYKREQWTQPTEQVIGIVKFHIKCTDTLSPKYTGQIKWKLLLTIS